jgi:hypothetical protein
LHDDGSRTLSDIIRTVVTETESVVLAYPSRCAPVAKARSTLLVGSVDSLRRAGHYDRYWGLLEPAFQDAVLHAVVGTWLPLDVALAHYRACDAIGLTPDEEVALGRSTFESAGTVIFGTILKMAKGSGVSPWTVLPHYQRFWDRGYDGGGIRVLRLGPKEARIELVQCPLADHRYYRNALRGLNLGVLGAFTSKVYVKEVASARAPGAMALRAQWV